MSTEEKELEVVSSSEAPKKPSKRPRKPVDPAVWDELKEIAENGEILTVKINAAVNAGVISYVKGIRGFIPASLLSSAYVEDLNEWVDKTIEVKVITVEPENKRLVLSGKAVEQEKAAAERAAKIAAVTIGDIYDGKVERITTFGAFVGFADGLSGLVHISQMANRRIESPNEVVKVGDEVKVKVIGNKDGKLSLSMKAVLDTDSEPVRTKEPSFDYKEDGKATTGLASLLANIQLDK
jgi:small subunit ribosomal protein S1